MLEFAIFSNRRGFAIAFGGRSRESQAPQPRARVNNSPSSSPIAINSERSSTYFPAYGFSITATAAARRVGGSTSAPSPSRSPQRTSAIFRILATRRSAFIAIRPLP